jgi:hypothetical protein
MNAGAVALRAFDLLLGTAARASMGSRLPRYRGIQPC